MKAGFVGVGAMGAAMAGHVQAKGQGEVFAYDVRREAVDALADQGIKPVDTLADITRAADVIVVIVVDDQQVLDVTEALSVDGVEGTLIAVAATVHPDTMRKAAEIAAAKGLRVIDAPVCFGLYGAKEGQLASLCGGSAEDIEDARPVLDCYSRAVHHIGPLGCGQIAKTVNNMLHWANCVANYEALLIAKRFGIDAQKLREVLLQCPARNGTLADWDSTRFTWPIKDMDIALALAREGELTLPLYGQVDHLVQTLTPDGVKGLLYGDAAPYLGRTVTAKDEGGHGG
ncbi:MAG TPA: NAD(P)-dependent oxidoreductase [Hyphomicrobiales bacterium]|nr:NAD(P)-dependent oxidoreductase [Hyphomicrobiales bacterium]